MSDVGGDGQVVVAAVADEQALNALTLAVEKAIEKGFDKGFKGLGTGLDAQSKRISATLEAALEKGFKAGFGELGDQISKALRGSGFEKIQRAARDAFKNNGADEFTQDLTEVDKTILNLINRLKTLNAAVSVQARAVSAQGLLLSKEAIQANQTLASLGAQQLADQKARDKQRNIELNAALQRDLVVTKQSGAERLAAERAALDAIGREQKVAGQQSIIEARASGQRRVAITRGIVESIVALEKGLGTAIAGIARTATSAISRLFSGIGNTISSTLRRNNQEFTEGLNTTLNRRESIIRESFNSQERIIRQSVLRQEQQIDRLRKIGSTGVAGAVTGRGVGVGLGGLVAGIGVGQLFRAGFADATALTEELNKNAIVFGQFANSVRNFTQDSVNGLALTQAQALNATGTFGNLFRAVGLTEEQSANFSISLTTLASDLASFNNTSVDEALTALRSGLVGETEPLKRFGVNLNDATLKAKALELGLYNGKGVLDANTKAQAAYALILEQTTLAQGDFARTADEGANAQRRAKAAVLAFASAVAGQLKGAVTVISNLAVPAFQTLSDLVSGENLSKGLQVLRDGLKGAALGLAAIVAAKGAVQVIQLLGVAIKLALTPMGLLVVAAAGVGAALAIILPRSQALRDAFARAGEALQGFYERAKDFLLPILKQVVDFIVNTGIPAVLTFAEFIGGKLRTAFDATVSFIRDTAIPAVRRFASLVADEVVPRLETAAQFLVGVFETVRRGVGRAIDFILPLIQPAIDGFARLGSAIAAVFTGGGFSNIGSGALSAIQGIGSSFANIGRVIGAALAPVGKQILDFFKNLFTLDNLKSVGEGILDVIEFVGRQLGLIISSQNFVKIVAGAAVAIGTAAALVGFRFLKGFAEGVIKNGPGTLKLIGNAILDGLEAVLTPTNIGLIILAAFAFTKLVKPIVNAFRSIGNEAGQSFGQGLKQSLGNTRGFLQGAIGGTSGIQARNVFGADKIAERELRDVNNQLRILGSTKVGKLGIDEARTEIGRLREGITDAQLAGLQFRDRVAAAFQAVGATLRGGAGVLGGLAQVGGAFLSAGANAGRSFLRGVGNISRDIVSLVSGQTNNSAFSGFGDKAGKSFSGSFRSSVSAGFGQIRTSFSRTMAELKTVAESQGTTLGRSLGTKFATGAALALGGFLGGRAEARSGGSGGLSALTAGLTGLAVGGPIVGAAAAGAALIGAEFGKADRAAEIFAGKVKTYADSIKTNLVDALKVGAGEVLTFADVLGNAEFAKDFASNLTAATREALTAAGVTAGQLTSSLATGDLDSILNQLGGQIDLTDGISAAEGAVIELTVAFEALGVSIDQANTDAAFFGDIGLNPQALNSLREVASIITKIDSGDRGRDPLFGSTDTGLIKTAIGNVTVLLDGLQGKTKQVDQAIQDLFNPTPTGGGFANVVNEAIVGIEGLGQRIAEEVARGSAEGVDAGTRAAANSQVALLNEQFASTLAAVVQQGIADGVIVDENTARFLTEGIVDAALAGVTDEKIKTGLRQTYENAIANLPPLIDASNATAAATEYLGAVSAYFEANPIKPVLDGQQSLTSYTKAAETYFTANPIKPEVQANSAQAATEARKIVNAMILQFGGLKSLGAIAGSELVAGVAAGIQNNTSATTAAASLATKLNDAIKNKLIIKSPSRVMMENGEFIGEGLAIGIQNSTFTVTSAGTDLGNAIGTALGNALADSTDGLGADIGNIVSDALTAAKGKAGAAATGLAATISDLFRNSVGSGVGVGGLGLSTVGSGNASITGITSAFQNFLTTFESSASSAFQVNGSPFNELSLSQKNILGESAFSLNPQDVLGAANFDALTGIFDGIASYGEQLLLQGQSAEAVAAQLTQLRNQYINQVEALGFSSDAVRALATQLGLSDAALAQFVANANAAGNALEQIANQPISNSPDNGGPLPGDDNRNPGEERPGSNPDGSAQTPEQVLAGLPRPIINYITLPYGDPIAVALAVTNRQTQDATIPG